MLELQAVQDRKRIAQMSCRFKIVVCNGSESATKSDMTGLACTSCERAKSCGLGQLLRMRCSFDLAFEAVPECPVEHKVQTIE